ncbi:5-carboxymethyl-2-hydroxymuconate isomerase [Sulfitobacter albidus]|uniref:5-carboxymethyl-2-hydroxymuconate isomerase n=1 Tax=Sulfitobacter albidus TaxID=2829501 RepID=A0A975JHU8_9RHOB|nr:5-carboxymethyl-2-hydroxymuconate Delta-isomerase [Sulfitobacter albidus]QUJ78210.1 5-carboxymethyl-2-hydroxymuconate isomerase [Sulfitobacter albidus]
MPHFQIDYSANLDGVVDMVVLCEAIRARAAKIETFPLAGIRVHATRVNHYAIADGNPDHGFIDLSVRLRAGREEAVKRDALRAVFATMTDFLTPVMRTRSIALSAEMRDIDPALSEKTGTIRDHLETPT